MAAKVSAIGVGDLCEVGQFLYENMGRRIAAERWVQSLTCGWSAEQPNHGMQLRDEGRLVGVILAIYSDQQIGDRVERFCNPHSWCVLDGYRNFSLQLVLPLVRQRGYHFTMFTPNPKVTEVFLGLRFKPLDDRVWLTPNLPAPLAGLGGRFIEVDPARLADRLGPVARAEYEAHRSLPWLHFVAFGRTGDACLAIYKTTRWKKMPCARLMHVSDRSAFGRHAGLLGHYLLTRHGLLVTRVEARFLERQPRLVHQTWRTQPKLFLSASLDDTQIRDIYSELVALDL